MLVPCPLKVSALHFPGAQQHAGSAAQEETLSDTGFDGDLCPGGGELAGGQSLHPETGIPKLPTT